MHRKSHEECWASICAVLETTWGTGQWIIGTCARFSLSFLWNLQTDFQSNSSNIVLLTMIVGSLFHTTLPPLLFRRFIYLNYSRWVKMNLPSFKICTILTSKDPELLFLVIFISFIPTSLFRSLTHLDWVIYFLNSLI